MPLAKVNQFLQPVLAKKNSDFIVDLALAAAESSTFKVNEAELFYQRVRNLIELPHDAGNQIAKNYANWHKPYFQAGLNSTMKPIYDWQQEQKDKNMPPTLPPVQAESKGSTNGASDDVSYSCGQPAISCGELDVFDTMMYGDLELEVKLSDAVKGIKDQSQAVVKGAAGILNPDKTAAEVKAQVGLPQNVPGVAVAQAAATMAPQYGTNPAMLQQLLLQSRGPVAYL